LDRRTPSAERRKEPRVAAQHPLRFTFAGKTVETRIVDLSNSGIRFHTPAALPVMSQMQINLELPDGSAPAVRISITGVVVRCAAMRGHPEPAYDAAIFFENISPASARARLQRFVREHVTPA
jgi:c-di-GMP-binding flagellar brake protein YcgR